jgi:hypothetical protein
MKTPSKEIMRHAQGWFQINKKPAINDDSAIERKLKKVLKGLFAVSILAIAFFWIFMVGKLTGNF